MRQAISYEMLMMFVGSSGAARDTALQDTSGIARLDFIQNYNFSFNVDRPALKQLGGANFATRQSQLAPDVDFNLEHYLTDGWNEKFIGLDINTGTYANPFASIFNINPDRNFYIIISNNNYEDSNSNYGSVGLDDSQQSLLGIGNSYISNFEISVAANELAKVNTSFIAANARVSPLYQPEINAGFDLFFSPAIFTTGTGFIAPNDSYVSINRSIAKNGVTYYRDIHYSSFYKIPFNGGCPYSACQISSSSVFGTGITFGFDFENFQSMSISIPFERKPLYGFGGNHPFYRKIQKPIIGTFNIDSMVDSFQKENLVTTFSNEDKMASGYNFDIMFSNYTGQNRFGVKIQNARLDSYSIGNSIGDRSIISTSWSFEVNESTGILFSGSHPEPTLLSNRPTDSFNSYPR